MQVIYARNHSPGSLLIRAAQWFSLWSHSGIVTPQKTVINARAFHGVVEEPLDEFLARYTAFQIVEVDVPFESRGIEWARSKLGCGYDYKAIANFILGAVGQGRERFHCVELVETACYAAGRERFRVWPWKVTVRQSWMVR